MILLQGKKSRIKTLRFSPDGRHLAAVDADYGLQVWEEPVHNREPSTRRKCGAAEFLPAGGKLLLSGIWTRADQRPRCLLHDLTGGPDVELLVGDTNWQFPVCVPTPDGKHLLEVHCDTTGEYRTSISLHRLNDPSVPIWRVERSDLAYSPPAFLFGGTHFVHFFRSAVFVRSLLNAKAEWQGANPDRWEHPVTAITGPLLACHCSTRVAVFRTDDLTDPPILLTNDGRKQFTGVAFHPSGRYLATANNDATIRIYDTNSWAVAHVYTWQVGRMRSVVFSPDGMVAAAGSDKGTIVLWDFDL